jgi:hypothetical protein
MPASPSAHQDRRPVRRGRILIMHAMISGAARPGGRSLLRHKEAGGCTSGIDPPSLLSTEFSTSSTSETLKEWRPFSYLDFRRPATTYVWISSGYQRDASSPQLTASPHLLARPEPADPGWAVSYETAEWQGRQLARCSSNSWRSAGDRSPQHVGGIPLGELVGDCVHGRVTPFSWRANLRVLSP